jgi:hypothetical protein
MCHNSGVLLLLLLTWFGKLVTTHSAALRVLVAVEAGVGADASRFAYFNVSATGNARFNGFTIDVMRKVNQ